MNNKPLRRIQSEAVLGGVAAGLADYFGMDKALMRVILIVLMIFAKGVPIVLLYIILWVALPVGGPSTPAVGLENNWQYPDDMAPKKTTNRGIEIVGYGLLLIGGFMLFDRLFHWMHLQKFIPAAILIGIGLFLILRNNNTQNETPTSSADSDRATPSWTDSAPISSWQPPASNEPTEPTTPSSDESKEDKSPDEPKA
ncbi:PspC domain-containing protein [Runella limosa]|jgi:phage shock protein PspC (stress-responsive transcriptional regulator)|uniref:PspC domain-containing protein n=1 Tax=Runella limosa TaxID=370978 RepID=UPI0004085BF2|nr:PspC domain-containing protein [Runella limosa]